MRRSRPRTPRSGRTGRPSAEDDSCARDSATCWPVGVAATQTVCRMSTGYRRCPCDIERCAAMQQPESRTLKAPTGQRQHPNGRLPEPRKWVSPRAYVARVDHLIVDVAPVHPSRYACEIARLRNVGGKDARSLWVQRAGVAASSPDGSPDSTPPGPGSRFERSRPTPVRARHPWEPSPREDRRARPASAPAERTLRSGCRR